MVRAVNKIAQEIHDWIVKNGYGTYEGMTGASHMRYRLRNGTYFTTGSTPSAQSAVLNAKSDVRKILGLKADGPNSGTYSHKKSNGFDGRVTTADRHPPEVHRLIKQVEAIDAEILSMQSRQDVFKLRKLATRRLQLTAQLQPFGVVLDPPRKVG